MPVFAISVIFEVFAVPAFSGIYHWNLPAGQYLSQPWNFININKTLDRNETNIEKIVMVNLQNNSYLIGINLSHQSLVLQY